MKRMKWADIAKCFAIVCVLIGHTSGVGDFWSRFIFSFHMPLFFIISGYFMKDAVSVKEAVKKDAKALLLPYGATCLVITLIAVVLAILKKESILAAVKTWVLASLFGAGGTSFVPSYLNGVRGIGALWFLLALFFAKAAIYLTQNLGKFQLPAIGLIFYIGYATTDLTWLPLSIQAGMCAAAYVYLGKLIRKYDLFNKTFTSKNCAIYISFAALWLFCIIFCGKLYMVHNFYGNGLLDITGSICATFCIVWISMLIERYIGFLADITAFIGSLTLAIICAHITELDIFPWQAFFNILNITPSVGMKILLRFALVTVICIAFYLTPVLNGVLYPQYKRKAKSKEKGGV